MKTRRNLATLGAGALALLLVGGVLWWWQPWQDQAEVGDAIELTGGLDAGGQRIPVAHRVEVTTPTARLEVRIGEPLDTLPEGAAGGDRGEVHAPDGSVFVPVDWGGQTTQLEAETLATTVAESDDEAQELGEAVASEQVVVTLDIGDEEIPFGKVSLDEQEWASPRAFVVPEGDLGNAAWQVRFDGVTQRVSLETGELDAGVAETFYSGPELTVDGGDATSDFPGEFVDLETTRIEYGPEPYLVPWLPGTGWVDEPGQAWLVLFVEATINPQLGRGDTDGSDGEFLADARTASVLLGGAATRDSVEPRPYGRYGIADGISGGMVWLVDDGTDPPTDLEVRIEYDVVRIDADGERVAGGGEGLTGTLEGHLELSVG